MEVNLGAIGLGGFKTADISGDATGDGKMLGGVDEFATGENEVFLLEKGDGGPPAVSAVFAEAGIEVAADDADENLLLLRHSGNDMRLAGKLQLGIMRDEV